MFNWPPSALLRVNTHIPPSRHGKPVLLPQYSPFTNQPVTRRLATLQQSVRRIGYTIYIYVYCIYWIYEKGTRNLFTPSRPVPFILIKFPRAKTNIYLYINKYEYTTTALQQFTYTLNTFSRENRLLIPLSFGVSEAGSRGIVIGWCRGVAYTSLNEVVHSDAAVE